MCQYPAKCGNCDKDYILDLANVKATHRQILVIEYEGLINHEIEGFQFYMKCPHCGSHRFVLESLLEPSQARQLIEEYKRDYEEKNRSTNVIVNWPEYF